MARILWPKPRWVRTKSWRAAEAGASARRSLEATTAPGVKMLSWILTMMRPKYAPSSYILTGRAGGWAAGFSRFVKQQQQRRGSGAWGVGPPLPEDPFAAPVATPQPSNGRFRFDRGYPYPLSAW